MVPTKYRLLVPEKSSECVHKDLPSRPGCARPVCPCSSPGLQRAGSGAPHRQPKTRADNRQLLGAMGLAVGKDGPGAMSANGQKRTSGGRLRTFLVSTFAHSPRVYTHRYTQIVTPTTTASPMTSNHTMINVI